MRDGRMFGEMETSDSASSRKDYRLKWTKEDRMHVKKSNYLRKKKKKKDFLNQFKIQKFHKKIIGVKQRVQQISSLTNSEPQ